MEEHTFFSQSNVTVTNARFMVGGQTYAMNNVTSVKTGQEAPGRGWPGLLVLIGIGCFWGDASFKFVGVCWFVLAAVVWIKQKPTFHVVLSTSASESQALSDQNKEFIDSVVAALNESIVHRG